MGSPSPSVSAGPILPLLTVPVHEAVQRLLGRLAAGGAFCSDLMATLCRDRAAEIAAIPVPVAAPLVRSAVDAATRALATSDPSRGADALATLRHLLACPSLRDVAIKASRLLSLATAAIEASSQGCDLTHMDAAAAAVLQVLQEAGVDVITAGLREESITPLIAALHRSVLGAAQVLLDAGADVNGRSRDGDAWSMCASAGARSDAGMVWLLEHGASLTLTDSRGYTVAHALPSESAPGCSATSADADFSVRWLRRVIAERPSLLEAQGVPGYTPLVMAVGKRSEECVAALLALGADVSAADADGRTALYRACSATSLPIVRQLIAAGAAGAAALPPGSPQARWVASGAVAAAVFAERGCGQCAARCGGLKGGNCADGLDILRAVLAAGVREAVGCDGYSLGSCVGSWLCAADTSTRVTAEHALMILQTLHAGGAGALAGG